MYTGYSEVRSLILVCVVLLFYCHQKVYAQNSNEFGYHLISSTPINHLYPGKILGVVAMEEENKIVSTKIMKGSLPEGMRVFDDGTIAVTEMKETLDKGKHKVKVEFCDAQGNTYVEKIKLKLLKPSVHQDFEASIRIAKTKFTIPTFTDHYKIGDVIAKLRDPNGAIVEANLIKGSIPPGVRFVGKDTFIVAEPDKLQDGEYFSLFILKDEKGGSSVLVFSLPIGVQYGDDNDNLSKLDIEE